MTMKSATRTRLKRLWMAIGLIMMLATAWAKFQAFNETARRNPTPVSEQQR